MYMGDPAALKPGVAQSRMWRSSLLRPPRPWWKTAAWLTAQLLIVVSAVLAGQGLWRWGLQKLELSDWADVATISGAVAAIGALVYTAIQIRQNTKAHRAEFWLTLRQMFSEHQPGRLDAVGGIYGVTGTL
jgi:hypothetical protein